MTENKKAILNRAEAEVNEALDKLIDIRKRDHKYKIQLINAFTIQLEEAKERRDNIRKMFKMEAE